MCGKLIGNPGFLRVPSEIGARIVRLRSDGPSYQKIAVTLNDERAPTAQGGWAMACINRAQPRSEFPLSEPMC